MAVTQQNMQVARCDAPSCKVMRTAPTIEEVQGYFSITTVVFSGGTHQLASFAHSAQHIGPAANAVIKSWEESQVEGSDGQESLDGGEDDHESEDDDEGDEPDPRDELPADEVNLNGAAAATAPSA